MKVIIQLHLPDDQEVNDINVGGALGILFADFSERIL